MGTGRGQVGKERSGEGGGRKGKRWGGKWKWVKAGGDLKSRGQEVNVWRDGDGGERREGEEKEAMGMCGDQG